VTPDANPPRGGLVVKPDDIGGWMLVFERFAVDEPGVIGAVKRWSHG
jgi:hypothetical protein